jgi:uncharacterized protein YecT (DUF1311 family)
MNACAGQERKRADTELNSSYRALLAKTAKQPETAAKIRTAQESWLVYRDAYLEAMFPAADKQTEYGSIYPMQLALLGAKLTRQQTAALKEGFAFPEALTTPSASSWQSRLMPPRCLVRKLEF